jgi:hypothetical protein
MPMQFPSFSTPWIIQSFAALFLAILFLQSGIDKIVDRQGNLAWLTKHFAQSPLASTVGRMFLAITILETTAGVLSGVGLLLIVVAQLTIVAYCGAIVATVALACLFFGQRVAKDYAGAAVLVPYILLALFAVWVLRPDPLVAL